jgi:quinol monooxygenase YgiN
MLRFNQELSTVELCLQVACPAGGLAHAHGRLQSISAPSRSRMPDSRSVAGGGRAFVEGRSMMVTVGLLVRLLAKPGKEAEVTSFLEGGLALVNQEPATVAWFAIRLGPSEFGIFDAFPDDAGRQAHLGGQVAAALMAQAPELLAQAPVIEPVDVIAAKLPGQRPTGRPASRAPCPVHAGAAA